MTRYASAVLAIVVVVAFIVLKFPSAPSAPTDEYVAAHAARAQDGGKKMSSISYDVTSGATKSSRNVSAETPLPTSAVMQASEWSEASDGVLPLTITKAGVAEKSHYITGFFAYMEVGTSDIKATLKDGATSKVVAGPTVSVGIPISHQFAHPIKITAGADASLVVSSSGPGSGGATLMGYTR